MSTEYLNMNIASPILQVLAVNAFNSGNMQLLAAIIAELGYRGDRIPDLDSKVLQDLAILFANAGDLNLLTMYILGGIMFELTSRGDRFPPDVDSKVLLAYAKLAGEKGDCRMILLCVIELRDRKVQVPLNQIAIAAARAGHQVVFTWLLRNFGWEVQPQVIENVDQIDWDFVVVCAAVEGQFDLIEYLLRIECPIDKEDVIEDTASLSHSAKVEELLNQYYK